MADTILSVDHLTKRFGGLIAVNDCSFAISRGKISGLIGPNGAGKTTMFNLICGILNPDSGNTFFFDEKITGLKPYMVARKGIGRTFQLSRVFKGMTVLENLCLVPPTHGKEYKKDDVEKRARELLATVGLIGFEDRNAGNLPYGLQKMLEFARACMCQPKLIFMDETFAGLNPEEIEKQIGLIRELRDKEGISFLVIDHAVSVILQLCEDIVVMDQGEILARGGPKEIENNEKVIEAYLGRFSLEDEAEER